MHDLALEVEAPGRSAKRSRPAVTTTQSKDGEPAGMRG